MIFSRVKVVAQVEEEDDGGVPPMAPTDSEVLSHTLPHFTLPLPQPHVSPLDLLCRLWRGDLWRGKRVAAAQSVLKLSRLVTRSLF